MAPAAASRHSGHVVDVLQRSPTIKPQYCCPISRNLKRESERLKTYKNWPVKFLDPKILAKNGFFYTQTDDVVKCIFCKIQIGFWEEGDDPAADHKREKEDCPFVKNEPCGNIPISEEEGDNNNSSTSENEVSQDVCGFRDMVLRPFSLPEKYNPNSFMIDSSNLWKDFEELGVSKMYRLASPNFATYASRIKTFEKWKSYDIQKPEKLAAAGFYYIGVDDNVLCFHCGGGLKNWEKNDDPWVEHAKWFCKCQFVFHHKGREFIIQVAKKSTPSFTSEQPKESVNVSKKYPENHSSKPEIEKSKESDSKKAEPSTSTSAPSPSSSSFKPTPSPSSSSFKPTPSSSSSLSSEKENSTLDETELKLCRICFSRERGIVFLPCGHFVCCPECTPSLTKCAVCREPFKATVRAYLS